MLQIEFVEAYREHCPEIAAKPLNRDVWKAINTAYISSRLDNVCTGIDRHAKFARWMHQNETVVLRLARRYARQRSLRRLEIQTEINRLKFELDLI